MPSSSRNLAMVGESAARVHAEPAKPRHAFVVPGRGLAMSAEAARRISATTSRQAAARFS